MATGIYRDPALERAAAAAAARAAQQGRVSVSLPASRRPDYQASFPTQSQVAASNIAAGGPGLAGGGFWEGGDIYINPVTNVARPTASAAAQLAQDPWANIDWEGLGRLMDTQDPGWRDRDTGTSTPSTPSTPTTPTTPVSSGGVSIPSGGGVSAPAPAPDTTVSDLLAALAEATALAREQITGAGTTLQEQLAGRDPMATYTWNRPTVSIPTATLADYVQATGGSPAEVQATQQLSQQLLDSFLGDVGQFAEATGAAEETWRGRGQDVGYKMTADALSQLALNEQAQKIAIQRSEADRARALQDQALSLLLQYATAKPSGSSLNVTVPQLPFNTVNIPGVGNVYVPNTLTGVTV